MAAATRMSGAALFLAALLSLSSLSFADVGFRLAACACRSAGLIRIVPGAVGVVVVVGLPAALGVGSDTGLPGKGSAEEGWEGGGGGGGTPPAGIDEPWRGSAVTTGDGGWPAER